MVFPFSDLPTRLFRKPSFWVPLSRSLSFFDFYGTVKHAIPRKREKSSLLIHNENFHHLKATGIIREFSKSSEAWSKSPFGEALRER